MQSATDPPTNAAQPAPQEDSSVIEMAQLIHMHLMQNWVAGSNLQARPHPDLDNTNDIQATVGEDFTVRLKNMNGTLQVKTAEVSDPTIAVLAEHPSNDGLFTFFALQPGKTTVRMRVAHAKTLVVAEIERGVVVSSPSSSVAA